MPPGARASIAPYKVYPLWEVLGETAGSLPQKGAVIDDGREVTFGQLGRSRVHLIGDDHSHD